MTVVSDSHYQSTLDAVYDAVPWSEFPIVPSYPHYPHVPFVVGHPHALASQIAVEGEDLPAQLHELRLLRGALLHCSVRQSVGQ